MAGLVTRVRSGLRFLLSNQKGLRTTGQAGDGRESAVLDRVLAEAEPGSIDDAIRVIDAFGHGTEVLINVGDEKGLLLDAAVRRGNPKLLLELGTYIGYSALRTARVMPEGAHLFTLEPFHANVEIARKIHAHAGVADRITVVEGKIGDPETMELLRTALNPGKLDFLFIDHVKDQYLADLQTILGEGWLHKGSIVVADNVKFPGSPEYRAYMKERQGKDWKTVEHETHVEYQSMLKDLVLESDYLGDS
jgi:catechol O-methyltransferase